MLDFLTKYGYSSRTHVFCGRPFALFMGPQRAGTTWIDQYLRGRGDICVPAQVKETRYFDRHYPRGFDFYHCHFSPKAPQRLMAEVTTTAFDAVSAPRRVYDTFGAGITLVCPLRHPVERAYSLYLHYLRYGKVRGSLQQACAQRPHILSSGRYANHIARWLDYFPAENIHFMYQEMLARCPDEFARALCEIIDMPFLPVPRDLRRVVNAAVMPANRPVAPYAQSFADLLRARRLYGPINLAKALGVKSLVFGRERAENSSHMISASDRHWLDEQLGDEIDKLERLIGPVYQWKDRIHAPHITQMVRSSHSPASGRVAGAAGC